MRWLDGITNPRDMNLGKFHEIVRNREVWCVAVHGVAKSGTWLSDWMTIIAKGINCLCVWQASICRIPLIWAGSGMSVLQASCPPKWGFNPSISAFSSSSYCWYPSLCPSAGDWNDLPSWYTGGWHGGWVGQVGPGWWGNGNPPGMWVMPPFTRSVCLESSAARQARSISRCY